MQLIKIICPRCENISSAPIHFNRLCLKTPSLSHKNHSQISRARRTEEMGKGPGLYPDIGKKARGNKQTNKHSSIQFFTSFCFVLILRIDLLVSVSAFVFQLIDTVAYDSFDNHSKKLNGYFFFASRLFVSCDCECIFCLFCFNRYCCLLLYCFEYDWSWYHYRFVFVFFRSSLQGLPGRP